MPQGFSKVRICNMALSKVGSRSNIEDLDTERTVAANACRVWYDAARLVTLEAYNWSFARKRKKLSLHVVDPPPDWAYRYSWPVDCVTPRLIENPMGREFDALPFDVEMGDEETRSILTHAEQATLVYTKDLDSPTLYSMHFIIMLATQLGAFINPEITGKVRIATRLENEFARLALVAPEHDADSSVPEKERDATWIRARA